MENQITLKKRAFKTLKWILISLVGFYFTSVAVRMVHFFNLEKTEAKVAEIHVSKITMADVMGENLPLDPGEAGDVTVAGIDINDNGIRDDVELAIFREYPNSAKKRAVSLQYALSLQLETRQPYINTEIVIAVVQEEDRAYICVGEIVDRDDNDQAVMDAYFEQAGKLRTFVEEQQFNTTQRRNAQERFYRKIDSYNSLPRFCDIDYSLLPN